MVYNGIKVSKDACQGCVNCIRSCPTEAIRVIDGEISILSELCIDCGECLRSCSRNALGIYEDDWNRINVSSRATVIADPVFFSQFRHCVRPDVLREVFDALDVKVLMEDVENAFDLSAYITAQTLAIMPKESLPMISIYCPSALRLIQLKFPDLLPRIIPAATPLEIAADLWRTRTNSDAPLTLLSPCPAKITMIHDPQGREKSPINNAVTIRRVARNIMASGDMNVESDNGGEKKNNRWIAWARRGGESAHVRAFSDRKLTTLAVSGIRNTLDLLQELELGRLRGVDFVECRVCDTGCLGGVGTADSRFLANLRINTLDIDWKVTKDEYRRVEKLYSMDIWPFTKELEPRPRTPLSDNVADAMLKLQQMNEIYRGLPHIDCGSCGRPSCQAMAEEIARGHGSVTDCIFKLREGIASLANQIVVMSESQLHTLKKRDPDNEDK